MYQSSYIRVYMEIDYKSYKIVIRLWFIIIVNSSNFNSLMIVLK